MWSDRDSWSICAHCTVPHHITIFIICSNHPLQQVCACYLFTEGIHSFARSAVYTAQQSTSHTFSVTKCFPTSVQHKCLHVSIPGLSGITTKYTVLGILSHWTIIGWANKRIFFFNRLPFGQSRSSFCTSPFSFG